MQEQLCLYARTYHLISRRKVLEKLRVSKLVKVFLYEPFYCYPVFQSSSSSVQIFRLNYYKHFSPVLGYFSMNLFE
jgi:hypothetical protein